MENKASGYYKNKLKYISKYNKDNYVQFNLKLHKVYDSDLLDLLARTGNKQKLIKDSLRSVAGLSVPEKE